MRSQMVPRSEMFRPLYSSMAPAAASSMSPSSVTTVGMFGCAFQIDLGLVGDASEGHRLKRRALRRNAALGIGLSRGP